MAWLDHEVESVVAFIFVFFLSLSESAVFAAVKASVRGNKLRHLAVFQFLTKTSRQLKFS